MKLLKVCAVEPYPRFKAYPCLSNQVSYFLMVEANKYPEEAILFIRLHGILSY